jgi:hypothetical protein
MLSPDMMGRIYPSRSVYYIQISVKWVIERTKKARIAPGLEDYFLVFFASASVATWNMP